MDIKYYAEKDEDVNTGDLSDNIYREVTVFKEDGREVRRVTDFIFSNEVIALYIYASATEGKLPPIPGARLELVDESNPSDSIMSRDIGNLFDTPSTEVSPVTLGVFRPVRPGSESLAAMVRVTDEEAIELGLQILHDTEGAMIPDEEALDVSDLERLERKENDMLFQKGAVFGIKLTENLSTQDLDIQVARARNPEQ